MYKRTVKKMQEKFEIVKIFDQLNTASLLADLTLSKYQKAIITYFKSQLVTQNEEARFFSTFDDSNGSSVNWKTLDKNKRSLIKKGLLQLYISRKPTKVSKRILRGLTSNLKLDDLQTPKNSQKTINNLNFGINS